MYNKIITPQVNIRPISNDVSRKQESTIVIIKPQEVPESQLISIRGANIETPKNQNISHMSVLRHIMFNQNCNGMRKPKWMKLLLFQQEVTKFPSFLVFQ